MNSLDRDKDRKALDALIAAGLRSYEDSGISDSEIDHYLKDGKVPSHLRKSFEDWKKDARNRFLGGKMKTGISTLDRLIGIEADTGEIKPGSIILLRGGPGSGKTTLALQILAEHMKTIAAQGSFVSVELKPGEIIDHLKEKFCFGVESRAGIRLPENSLDKVILISRENYDSNPACRNLGDCIRKTLKKHKEQADLQTVFRDICEMIRGGAAAPDPRFIVIDSLNALLSMLSAFCPEFRKQDLRGQLQELAKASRNNLQESVVLFTAEYHPTSAPEAFGSLVSESFVCDIEIILRPEPVSGTSSLPSSAMNQLGYAVERHQTHHGNRGAPAAESWSEQAVEIRSFCRVIKSRWSHNQSRRCQYDIVEGKGVVFDETYPGDGNSCCSTRTTSSATYGRISSAMISP
jgi:archaellum biogenesis ATPase FlaH